MDNEWPLRPKGMPWDLRSKMVFLSLFQILHHLISLICRLARMSARPQVRDEYPYAFVLPETALNFHQSSHLAGFRLNMEMVFEFGAHNKPVILGLFCT